MPDGHVPVPIEQTLEALALLEAGLDKTAGCNGAAVTQLQWDRGTRP